MIIGTHAMSSGIPIMNECITDKNTYLKMLLVVMLESEKFFLSNSDLVYVNKTKVPKKIKTDDVRVYLLKIIDGREITKK
ncbi:MAG: hypothetical protein ACRCX8_04810 [Sarcina sp.]